MFLFVPRDLDKVLLCSEAFFRFWKRGREGTTTLPREISPKASRAGLWAEPLIRNKTKQNRVTVGQIMWDIKQLCFYLYNPTSSFCTFRVGPSVRKDTF